MDETNYFNGRAAQLNIKNRLLTGFWSIRDIDATIENNCILNFKTDGKHNTYSTLQKKGNVNNITTGLHLFQRGEYYKIGLLTMFTTFDKSITGQDVLYKKYQYTGRNCINLSVD